MKKQFALFLALAVPAFCIGQPVAASYGEQISTDHLKKSLTILASDSFEGRETGKRGQKEAAAFISAYFQEIGLTAPVEGSYYQPIDLYCRTAGESYLRSGTQRFKNFEEVIYQGAVLSTREVTVPLVFAGKGKKENFEQLVVAGKAVLVVVESNESYMPAVGRARERGAKVVLIVNPAKEEFPNLIEQYKSILSSHAAPTLKKPESNSQTGLFFVSPVVAEKLFGMPLDKIYHAGQTAQEVSSMKEKSITYFTAPDFKTMRTENVLGFLEGTDKKDEVVVITAHYDHIGMRDEGDDRVNNGADDDGSGTSAIMELARVFSQSKKDGHGPRRSILFMAVTGEEIGLFGSEYYSEHPVFPLEKTVVDLNIDMIGRRDPAHKNSNPYVYVIGSDKLSKELHELSETTNSINTQLIFDYTYNSPNHPDMLYYRSDHWNFAKKKIPIVFYFDGIHEDYHQASDEVSKIEFDLLAKRTQCIFYLAWEIANRDQRVSLDNK